MRAWRLHCFLGVVTLLSGCSGLQQDRTINWSASKLYQAAKADMNGGRYTGAINYYSKFLSRYPYGRLAQQSMLDLAYSYYRSDESDKALAQLDQFIHIYPRHPYIDYALYMKGVVEYEKNVSFFDRFMPTNLAQTDPQASRKAFLAFAKLVREHPNSEYAADARYRMVFLRNILGEHELSVADYYLRNGSYVAAVARAKSVLENYQSTPSAPYALAIMVRGYRELNEEILSQDAMRVLQANFADRLNDAEIRRYLNGDIAKQRSLWERYNAKPKI